MHAANNSSDSFEDAGGVCAGAVEAAAPPPEVEDAAGLAESVAHLTDLTSPASWYPAARMMRRRVVAHVGPTNSGKTHAALLELKAAASGVYCGPLRLLAWEVRMRTNQPPYNLPVLGMCLPSLRRRRAQRCAMSQRERVARVHAQVAEKLNAEQVPCSLITGALSSLRPAGRMGLVWHA